MNQKSLANLRPKPFTKENAAFWGRIGGSRRTVAKTRAAKIRNARKRICISCKWLEQCNMGQTQVKTAPKHLVDKLTCILPTRQLIILSDFVNGEYENLYSKMLFWLQQEAETFTQKVKILERLEKLLVQKNVNLNLIKEEKDIKITMEIVDARTITERSRGKKDTSITIDADTSKE